MTTPVSAAEFASLMAPLGPFEAGVRVAVAVSGGSDSLALALLSQDWARARGGSAIGLIVDHGLRPDSSAEALQVGQWLLTRGMDYRILVWDGAKPAAGIQAGARAARYGLLEDFCRTEGVLHLLLGHHQDDQAETLLLRLGRGSGVDGLAAMAAVQDGCWLRWLRPLLGMPRARLAATLSVLGQDWVHDPSNDNTAFTRVRMRSLLPVLAAEGLTVPRLAATARRLGRARAAQEQAVAELAARWVSPDPAGFMVVDPAAFIRPPQEVGLRLLTRLLLSVGGGVYPPRLERSENLYFRLRAGLPKPATLAGCRVSGLAGKILFCRETAKMAPPLALDPGAELAWDGRFRLNVAVDAASGLTLGALGPTGWNQVAALAKPRLLRKIPPPVRPTLPAIYDDDAICAVPHLGYNRTLAEERTLRWIVAAPSIPMTAVGHCLV